MDNVIKITLGLFIVILAGTVGFVVCNGYISNSYSSSLTSTYSYSLSITTDHPLTNVTFFIPVPADRKGNSPVVSLFSADAMPGVPESWSTILFDTGKATLIKIHVPAIIPPAGTTHTNPYTVTFSADIPSETIIDTASPDADDAAFRPVQELTKVACMGHSSGGNPECATFLTSMYADYTADPDTAVTITSSIQGKNSWTVFEPRSNEYSMVTSLLLHGENHGWATMKGTLERRIGSFDYPFHIS